MLPRNKKCAVTSNYSMTSQRIPFDIYKNWSCEFAARYDPRAVHVLRARDKIINSLSVALREEPFRNKTLWERTQPASWLWINCEYGGIVRNYIFQDNLSYKYPYFFFLLYNRRINFFTGKSARCITAWPYPNSIIISVI